ncbi:MAG TPA: hypothetical protein VN256_14325 [Pyrinomonadaceae bacterium]|nr:hypothetical protein [Pyrinomonadaceae bacterium]
MIVSPAQTDELLHPFLLACDEGGEEAALAALFAEHVAPLARRILGHKLQFYARRGGRGFDYPEVEDVYQDVYTRLLRRLRALKADPASKPINNLRSYVAALTRTTCDEYLRHKYPQRRYLKDKLRYQLATRDEFALWEAADGVWLAGLADWAGRAAIESPDRDALAARLGALDAHAQSTQELLRAIFHAAAQPLELEYLTALVASLWGIEDRPHESLDASGGALAEQLAYPQADAAAVLESRELLDRLWAEICQLPRRQRVALLCNLRNQHGVNVITLLPATGVVGVEQIASALEIPLPEFEQLWAALPLDDLRLAQYLGATRQQVINLRRSARDRLARRLKDWSPKTR